ncbi:MAG: DUF4160 domain-containing protein [Caldilineaceae bacterium]|nr:DUF4160 domain-containing protein [Caldilineaceae bacterium]
MPLLKTIGPYEFRFYSRGEANEPPHVHVRRGRLEAKFWLLPGVRLARGGRFRTHELGQIAQLVQENREEFLDGWKRYFG